MAFSPDGKTLAFVRRVDTGSRLFLRDLETGEERSLFEKLDKDLQEAWAVHGVYAQYDWLPDGSGLVVWGQGKIWRVSREGGQPAQIPFRADIEQTLMQPIRVEQTIESGRFQPKMIRDVATSPDGRTVVFHAVGHPEPAANAPP